MKQRCYILCRTKSNQELHWDATTTLAVDITKTKTVFDVADASNFTENTYIDLNGEELYIKSITGNQLNVRRAQDGTTAATHVAGEPIYIINAADNALIEEGDDFGSVVITNKVCLKTLTN